MRGVLRLEMVWFCRGLHRDGGLGVESFKTLKYGCQQGLPNAMASRTSLCRWRALGVETAENTSRRGAGGQVKYRHRETGVIRYQALPNRKGTFERIRRVTHIWQPPP